MKDTETYDVGVIVGRFQIPQLHDGHKKLINHVAEKHKKVIIVLGVSHDVNSTNNPLDFQSRAQMIQEFIPHALVLPILDTPDDDAWSVNLDKLVSVMLSPKQDAVLYGSRDSFINAYTGKLPTFELLQEGYLSGTEIRNQVRKESRSSEDFRAGVIWASANRFTTVYTCVDIAIFKDNFDKMALARKSHDKAWRLVGGFADIDSKSFEEDAYREVMEETGMGLYGLKYLGSFNVEDWRYAKEPDGVRTLLFRGTTSDLGRPMDDIAELKWFDTEYVKENIDKMIIDGHKELVLRALEDFAND